MRWMKFLFLSFAFLCLTGWGHWGPNVKIGLALDSAQTHGALLQKLKTAMDDNRADLLVKDANGDPKTQQDQVHELIAQGIQTLIVLPCDPEKAATFVNEAHQAGIPVISLEQLIPNSALDYLIAFNPVKAGELQAKALVKKVPQGRYILLGKNPAQADAQEFRKGQMKVLQPLIDRGDIQIAASKWDPTPKDLSALLAPKKNPVDALLVSDSELANQCAHTLEKLGLSGKTVIAGSGDDLATCQRIANGAQWMTVYHTPEKLAEETAYLGAKLARKATEFDCEFVEVNNGLQRTKAVLLTPQAVEAQDLRSTVIQDGLRTEEDVFKK